MNRRILVHHRPGRGGDALLRRCRAHAAAGDDVRVVGVIDTRSAFDADGPAAQLPDERASRRIALANARLARTVRRLGPSQAQAVVLDGVAANVLSALIDNWRPDVVLCDERSARRIARQHPQGPALVTLRRSLLDRLAVWRWPLAAGEI